MATHAQNRIGLTPTQLLTSQRFSLRPEHGLTHRLLTSCPSSSPSHFLKYSSISPAAHHPSHRATCCSPYDVTPLVSKLAVHQSTGRLRGSSDRSLCASITWAVALTGLNLRATAIWQEHITATNHVFVRNILFPPLRRLLLHRRQVSVSDQILQIRAHSRTCRLFVQWLSELASWL